MLLLANVDDVSGELIPHAIDGLMAHGASSVHVVQAITKKGRLEYLFLVDAEEECIEVLSSYLARELGTLGVRIFDPHHIKFAYRFHRVGLSIGGDKAQMFVRVKELLDSDGQVISLKAELEDLRAALFELNQAEPWLSLKGLKRIVEKAAQDRANCYQHSVRAEYLGALDE